MSKNSQELKAIFWDFDGVILDSNIIRDQGFEQVLINYPQKEVSMLMDFHRLNGGLSRYVKFRYFFEEIRNESITETEVNQWAAQFSALMRKSLTDASLLISETVNYIRKHYQEVPMFIVSGSDQEELRYLCRKLGIHQYFQRIHGSPKPKKKWIEEILLEEALTPEKCLLVGDSRNDKDAALENGIHFMGYNNIELEKLSTHQLVL